MRVPIRLKSIDILPLGQEAVLRVEGVDGQVIELLADLDQLDALADRLDDVLLDEGAAARDEP